MFGTRVLEKKKSKYNGLLRVVRSWGMGTYIQADGLTQSGGIVGTIWKQTLRKIRSLEFKIDDVLVLGLGGGTVAELVKKHWPEAKITGVDIDPVMVEMGRKYLNLDEAQVKVRVQDAYDYSLIANRYDLVIVDLYRGDKFPEKFESEKFLKSLTGSKLVIFNRLYYGDKKEEAIEFGGKLEKIFTKVKRFYPEANLMFLCYNK